MCSDIARHILPVPDRPYVGTTSFDANDPGVRFEPIRPIRPPPDAPNIFLVLLDDAGFGSNSAFGGPCRTPTFERLAANGLRYTRFHTTAICSSTRQALLTGRNHTPSAWAPSRIWRPRLRATRACGRIRRQRSPRPCG